MPDVLHWREEDDEDSGDLCKAARCRAEHIFREEEDDDENDNEEDEENE